MKNIKTNQELFWEGEFGDEYIDRNRDEKILASKVSMFSEIIKKTSNVKSVFEVGANIGLNMIALNQLLPDAELNALEINKKAYQELQKLKYVNSYLGSILDFNNTISVDLVFCCTVLIHINPNSLDLVYHKIAKFAKRYVLFAEYYNPVPVQVNYRGNDDCLFKRDFAGDFLKIYKNFRLIDYSFVYHKDNVFPGDDITWFLMEKMN